MLPVVHKKLCTVTVNHNDSRLTAKYYKLIGLNTSFHLDSFKYVYFSSLLVGSLQHSNKT